MFLNKAVDVADTLLLQDFIHGNENARLLYIAEAIIDGCTKELHGRTEVHVGIYQRRNIETELANLMIQNAIVSTEIIFRKDGSKLTLRSLQLQWLHRNDEVLLVIEVLLQEIENHVAAATDVRRIHRHLAEEILHFRIENRQGAQTIPQIIKGKDALGVGAHILIFQ